MTHGEAEEADDVVQDIEKDVREDTGERLSKPDDTIEVEQRRSVGFGPVVKAVFGDRLNRAASRICSVNSSSASRHRATDPRACARAASAERSDGTGTTRSGRSWISAPSASSGSARSWSTKLEAIVSNASRRGTMMAGPGRGRTGGGKGDRRDL